MRKPIRPRPFVSLIGLLLAADVAAQSPEPLPVPADQLLVSGNACGPAALLNAFRFGNPAWQRAALAIPGETDKQRIQGIIRDRGMRPSGHLKGRARWSRQGVNLPDLRDMANEMTAGHFLPRVGEEVFFLKKGETPEKLLVRVHQRLEISLSKGLPPIISLRRFMLRGTGGKPAEWVLADAHFVTVTSVPRKLERGARSFSVDYIDPWGGKRCQGTIAISERPFLSANSAPCLEAAFPQAGVGLKRVRPGERSVIALAGALGRW